jgi:hypothetical protein
MKAPAGALLGRREEQRRPSGPRLPLVFRSRCLPTVVSDAPLVAKCRTATNGRRR